MGKQPKNNNKKTKLPHQTNGSVMSEPRRELPAGLTNWQKASYHWDLGKFFSVSEQHLPSWVTVKRWTLCLAFRYRSAGESNRLWTKPELGEREWKQEGLQCTGCSHRARAASLPHISSPTALPGLAILWESWMQASKLRINGCWGGKNTKKP